MNGGYAVPESLSSRRRFFKKEARAVLCFRSNWASVLFSLFAVLFFFVCAGFFSDCFFSAFELSGIAGASDGEASLFYLIYSVVSALLLFFLLSPLYPGIYSYFYDLYRSRASGGAQVPPSELFCAYASLPFALRAWKLAFLRLLTFAAVPLSVLIGYLLGYPVRMISGLLPQTAGIMVGGILQYGLGFFLILSALGVVLFGNFLIFLSVTRPEISVSTCAAVSFRLLRRHAVEGMLLCLSFIPLFLLSVLSAGILFFLYVLPYYIFAFISFCSSVSTEAER